MADFSSENQALEQLRDAGAKGDWNLCEDALAFLLRERLNGESLDRYEPAMKEEAEGLLSVLAESGLHEAPKGSPVRSLYDMLADFVEAGSDVDDAFQTIMDL